MKSDPSLKFRSEFVKGSHLDINLCSHMLLIIGKVDMYVFASDEMPLQFFNNSFLSGKKTAEFFWNSDWNFFWKSNRLRVIFP